MLLIPTSTKLVGQNVYWYFIFFPGVVVHFHSGSIVVPCYQGVVVLGVTNHYLLSTEERDSTFSLSISVHL